MSLLLSTGMMMWVNCGHPAPLLIRRHEIIPEALNREPELPLGLGSMGDGKSRQIHQAQLEPDDRVLLYTDGVTDARSESGERFGEQRFTDFVIKATAAGEPALESPGTLPVGFGGATPQISDMFLSKGDRLLFFTDGLIEEHREGGEIFGERRMVNAIERLGPSTARVGQTARRMSQALMQDRGGTTSDDATLFLLEWQGGAANRLAVRDV